jgi:hypothetical protein
LYDRDDVVVEHRLTPKVQIEVFAEGPYLIGDDLEAVERYASVLAVDHVVADGAFHATQVTAENRFDGESSR